ncbi:adenylosuccinate lyase [Actinopolymorpha pittospori]|uniref:Adenylosuccinate lyase n=1 Tax=Actinopolymorpha pittospori TaxID=648752 RepID=A0A927N1Q4_9ACTN|nr:adenylosuccinate lyase [Actinopolymorpha pittospori]
MITRYTSPEMASIFSDENRLRLWWLVELAVIDAYAVEGIVPSEAAAAVRAALLPSVEDVLAREQILQHDLVAFLSAWTRPMPPEMSRWVHRGLTSSDVVDTALALQLTEASDLIEARTDRLVEVLRAHALEHRETVRAGRTHGQVATLDVWGHRVADFALAAVRARRRLRAARHEVAVAKLSGPTGSYLHVPASVEIRAAGSLGLRAVDVATQVVLRDRLANWMCALALLASVCEAVALEVRLGQHGGVREIAEPAARTQVGSSSMPHKRNPVASERICGLARVVRSYVVPVMEGLALWHERDLSHSSVERICVPDAAALTEQIVVATAHVIDGLHVDASQMASTAAAAGAQVASHSALIALTDAGMGWEEAWKAVKLASDTACASGEDPSVEDLVAALRVAAAEGTLAADLSALTPDPQTDGLRRLFARLEDL